MIRELLVSTSAYLCCFQLWAQDTGPIFSEPILMGESGLKGAKSPFPFKMEFVGHERLDVHQIALRPGWQRIQVELDVRFEGSKMRERAVEMYLWDKAMKTRSRFYFYEKKKGGKKYLFTIDPAVPFDGEMRETDHPSVQLLGKQTLEIYRKGKTVTVKLGGKTLFDFGTLKEEYHTLRFEVKGYRVFASNLRIDGFQY